MRDKHPSLYVCAALLVCWPALAFAQLVPDPGAPPQTNAAPAAQAPGDGQAPAAAPEQAPADATSPPTPANGAPDSQPALPPPGPPTR